jgi:anti-sigma-K factor RskA
MELTYNQILELLPAYALGALEPEEMLAVDAYLNKHQELLARLNQVEEAAAQLAYAAPVAPLPPMAKDRLMSRVYADLDGQALPAASVTPPAPVLPPARLAPSPSPQPGWWPRLRSAFTSPWWAVAAGTAMVLLLVSFFYLNGLQAQLRQANSQLSNLEGRVAELEIDNIRLREDNENIQQQAQADRQILEARVGELEIANTQLQQNSDTLQQQTQADQQLLLAIAGADPNRAVQISGTEPDSGAGGALYVLQDNQGVLVLHGLEPLPADQTYQLWLIPSAADADPLPAGLLEVEQAVPTSATVQIPANAQDFAGIAVSIEPAGGSPAPTGPIVLLGQSS